MMPSRLLELVNLYDGKEQRPVQIRPSSWSKAVGDGLAAEIVQRGAHAANGDVTLTRDDVVAVCADVADAEPDAVLRAFVTVMAWGSGKTNTRSLRYTPMALRDGEAAVSVLRDTARTLLSASKIDGDELKLAHESFVLSGVGPSFFTKWFAFAGRRQDRDWQPLIFDARVGNTLNKTLGTTTRELNGGRGPRSDRYRAWIRAMHDWAEQISRHREFITAERLEWIMFDYNGGSRTPSVQSVLHDSGPTAS